MSLFNTMRLVQDVQKSSPRTSFHERDIESMSKAFQSPKIFGDGRIYVAKITSPRLSIDSEEDALSKVNTSLPFMF